METLQLNGNIKAFLLKLYVYWVVSGFILTVFSVLFVWLTGSFVEIFTELIISLIVESFIFPISIIVAWVITPWQVIFHIAIFTFLLVLFEFVQRRINS